MALTDNLTSYWKLDESSGNASDSVGSNTGTNTNVTYDTGKINNGAVFNGSAKLVMGDVLNIAGAVSVSAWVYYSGTGTYTIVARGSGDNTQYILDIENKVARFYVRNTGGTYYIASKSAVPENELVFITGTWVGSTAALKVYVNGVAGTDSSAFSGTQATGSTFNIGVAGTTTNYFVNGGKIDEVGIWSRALSSTEVTELYNSGAGRQYPFGIAYALVCQVTTYALTGINILIKKAINLATQVTAYTLTGIDVALNKGKGFIASVANYTLTTFPATFKASWLKWTNQSKTSSTWSNTTKNNSTFTNQSKTSSTWTNLDKS